MGCVKFTICLLWVWSVSGGSVEVDSLSTSTEVLFGCGECQLLLAEGVVGYWTHEVLIYRSNNWPQENDGGDDEAGHQNENQGVLRQALPEFFGVDVGKVFGQVGTDNSLDVHEVLQCKLHVEFSWSCKVVLLGLGSLGDRQIEPGDGRNNPFCNEDYVNNCAENQNEHWTTDKFDDSFFHVCSPDFLFDDEPDAQIILIITRGVANEVTGHSFQGCSVMS